MYKYIYFNSGGKIRIREFFLIRIFLKKHVFAYFTDLAVPGFSCGMWDPVPYQELNPGPLPWKGEVLATGPPGKSLCE